MSHFIFKGNRHFHFSDEDINRLYNACEIGLNTCSGEGFGLCNFEQGYIGRPQVVSRVGGLKTCLNGAYYVDPTGYQYSLEGVGGFAYDFDYLDFVKGLLLYCRDPAKRDEDGRRIREFIQSDSKYKWENIAQDFMKVWEK